MVTKIYHLKPRPMVSVDEEAKIRAYNFPLIQRRAIHTLQGIATAVVYDGKLDDIEMELIVKWIEKNREFINLWPVSRLVEMLAEITEDGIIDKDERRLLLTFLEAISVNPNDDNPVVTGIFDKNPRIEFSERSFVFTGALQFGTRKKAEKEVIMRGGIFMKNYRNMVDYLVVGKLGSDAWKYNRYGRKIETCMTDKKAGCCNALIVNESDFVRAVIDTAL